ncbi:MAG: cytochrome P450 [Thermoleophilaceae bacterium]|nr:cytochrome P450 [Thermoleophilaceae bacterium]
MTTAAEALQQPLDKLDLGNMDLWVDGPPHEVFERLRNEAPVHWSAMETWEGEKGFWSITRAEDIRTVSLDWKTFSSEKGGILAPDNMVPLEAQTGMFIGMDPPRHDRIKSLFQQGFTPKRIAQHEEAIRAIARKTLDRLGDRVEFDLVDEVIQPVVARVIGSFLGAPEEDDATWAALANQGLGFGDPELQPEGAETVNQLLMEVIERGNAVIADRRANPTDDLASVLVYAEVDGEKLEDYEILMGIALLVAAGNDSTKATASNGFWALMKEPEQMRKLVEDPGLIPSAVEEVLRMFPAFVHFRRTATCDTVLNGQAIAEGDKVVMWYPSGNRQDTEYKCPHQLDVERNPTHQAFGAGGRHFCLGAALARLELNVLFEEILARYPNLELNGDVEAVCSIFINQPRKLPVKVATAS